MSAHHSKFSQLMQPLARQAAFELDGGSITVQESYKNTLAILKKAGWEVEKERDTRGFTFALLRAKPGTPLAKAAGNPKLEINGSDTMAVTTIDTVGTHGPGDTHAIGE